MKITKRRKKVSDAQREILKLLQSQNFLVCEAIGILECVKNEIFKDVEK